MNRVFITGASSGIGAALAAAYAGRGAQLGLVGRRQSALSSLADRLPGQHRTYVLDVRDRPALHAAAADFLADGFVDTVIASAGISIGTLTEELDDHTVFEAVMAVNLTATVSTFEPFIASMKQHRRGRLVGMSSVAAMRGLPGAGAYSASKAAVKMYCESLRTELKPAGVRVVTLAPGFIDTPMTAGNPYKMPFLMPVDQFAACATRAIERGVSYKVIPWQMAWVARLLHCVPDRLYDRIVANRQRKPRMP